LHVAEEIHDHNVVHEEDIISRLSAEEIFKWIMELPVGYRTVFNLYVLEGMTHKEIACLLHISEGTSKSQLSKARNMMQQLFTKNHGYEGRKIR
jgi:RNA polymerase sigma-70 factor (ECF subfamily)